MKRRWIVYLLVGCIFGIFDFFYHGFLANILGRQEAFMPSALGEFTWLVLSVGIWLVPVIPIALYEAGISGSCLRSALASILTWCTSIISYYLTNAVQLMFLGLPSRPELHVSNHSAPLFWMNWAGVFWQDIVLAGIVRWSVVAVISGSIIGFLTSYVYLQFKKVKSANKG